MQQTRRQFGIQLSTLTLALTSGKAVFAQAMVDPADNQAKSLGYIVDVTKVEKAKLPAAFKAGSQCDNCQLYQGKAGSAAAGCGIFPGKQVAGKAWCSAWVKKAG